MRYSEDQLDFIYRRTDGRCHICHGDLARCNYGVLGGRGAWEVEHSNPRANGGTDRLNNLYAAHIGCNRSKGAGTTRTARAAYGRTRAPMSAEKRSEARTENAAVGGFLGLVAAGMLERAVAGLVFGPGGVLACIALGALVAFDADPEG